MSSEPLERSGRIAASATDVAAWLAERVRPGRGEERITELFADWRDWRAVHDLPAIGREAFIEELEAHGVTLGQDFGGLVAINIELDDRPIIIPHILQWARERCRRDPAARTRWGCFCRDYRAWCERHGLPAWTRGRFYRQLGRLGAHSELADGCYRLAGLALVEPPPPPRVHPLRDHPDLHRDIRLGEWAQSCLERQPGAVATLADLHAHYLTWARGYGCPVLKRHFATWLARQRGVARWRGLDGRRGFAGVGFRKGVIEMPMSEEDRIRWWLKERCALDDRAFTLSATLYADFVSWCTAKQIFISSPHLLGRRLKAMGFPPHREALTRRHGFLGVTLKSKDEAAAAGPAAAPVGELPLTTDGSKALTLTNNEGYASKLSALGAEQA